MEYCNKRSDSLVQRLALSLGKLRFMLHYIMIAMNIYIIYFSIIFNHNVIATNFQSPSGNRKRKRDEDDEDDIAGLCDIFDYVE